MTSSTQVDEFEALRPHLLAVAYRLTGMFADAEDIVQDAWLRYAAAERDQITDLRAWLTTVVSRLGLDRLRSAPRRRESYLGQWLPEPVVTHDDTDPLSAVVAGEDARFAVMVVLERLTPDQRVAFVLHDGFAVPFDEVAADPSPQPDPAHAEAVGSLMTAMASGDLAAVVALLHPDVTFTGDANRRAPTAVRVIHGSAKVARFLLGLSQRYGPTLIEASRLALVNGELGAYTPGAAGAQGFAELMPRVTAMTVRDGRVVAIWDIANPDKFSGTPLCESIGE